MRRIFYAALILLLTPVVCLANDEQHFRDYLQDLKKANTSVFYSECRLSKGKAALLFPVGQTKGLFVESIHRRVVNSANVYHENGKWSMDEALGGVYTVTRLGNLIEELLGYSFQLLKPESLDRIATSAPKRKCVEYVP